MKDTILKLNLQLFAIGENAHDGTGMTTTNDLPEELKTLYSKDLIETVGANLVHAQFGDKVSIGKGKGRKIEWRKFSKFKKALQPLTEGVTPVPHMLEVTTITKKVEQFGDFSIITDVLDLTAIDPVIAEYVTRHSENAALTLDTIVRNELNTGTNVMYAGGKESRSALDEDDLLTIKDVAKAATRLKKMNAPKIDGSYVCIVHPSVAHDIMTADNWIDVQKYTNNVERIFNGELGKLYGVRFVESTEAMIFRDAKLGGQNYITVTDYDAGDFTFEYDTSTYSGVADGDLAGKLAVVKITTTIPGVGEAADTYTYTYESVVITSNRNGVVTLSNPLTVVPASGTTVALYPAGGSSYTDSNSNTVPLAVYSCLFLAKGAYKVVDIDRDNAEIIVKSHGSSGAADPLNQRASIGWKINGYGAAIVIPEYILRCECTSTFSEEDYDEV